MCRCVGVWVGMWVHARRLTGGQPRRVRAGPDFEKNSRSGFQILSRGSFLFENRSLVDFQIRNDVLSLHKEFRAAEIRMGAMLMKMAVFSE